MNLRGRLLALLARGDHVPDPDEFVELTTVPAPTGPLLVARLRRAGIDAYGAEAFDPGARWSRGYRVWVRRRDVARADEVSTA